MRKQLSEETWEILIKVNLGIADMILSESVKLNDPSESIAVSILTTVFDVMIYSGTQKASLFNILSILSFRWTHRESFWSYWGCLCFGLTQRMLNILYGYPYSYVGHIKNQRKSSSNNVASATDIIQTTELQKYVIVNGFISKQEAKILNICEEQTIFLWFRLVFLFDKRMNMNINAANCNNNKMKLSPEGFMIYLKKLKKIMKEFSKIGNCKRREIIETYIEQEELDIVPITRIELEESEFKANMKKL